MRKIQHRKASSRRAALAAAVIAALAAGAGCARPIYCICHRHQRTPDEVALVGTSFKSASSWVELRTVGAEVPSTPMPFGSTFLELPEGTAQIELLPGRYSFEAVAAIGDLTADGISGVATVERGQCYAPAISCADQTAGAASGIDTCQLILKVAACPSRWFVRRVAPHSMTYE